ncbi:integrase, catalytic region, zinc finger, CCHC-type containing protein [Tanacetum coccineum]
MKTLSIVKDTRSSINHSIQQQQILEEEEDQDVEADAGTISAIVLGEDISVCGCFTILMSFFNVQDPISLVANTSTSSPSYSNQSQYHQQLSLFAQQYYSPLVTTVQGRQNQGYAGSGARSNATVTRGNITEGTNTAGQAKVIHCYNCQEEGHMARQCTKPKRPKNSTWFKEKAVLAEALESMMVLDEEHMAFLADNRDTITQSQQSQEIPTPTAFQTNDLDAFDSDCDEAPSASVVFMAKLSSYDSTTLSEVPPHDNYLDNHVIDQNVQEMQYFEQLDFNNNPDIDITKMSNQVAKCNKVDKENKTINESLTTELARYKEQIKLFEKRQQFDLNDREKYIDGQLRKVIVEKNAKVADFENQIHSLKQQLNATVESHMTLSTAIDVLKTESKVKEDKYLDELIELEKQKKALDNVIYKMGLHKEITVMKEVFTQMETEAVKCSVERKTFEIKEKELLLENDRLLELLISQDLVHTTVNYLAEILDYQSMEKSFLDEYSECVELKAELSKKNDKVEKDAPEFLAFFEINDLKARLKAKDKSINKLREHIATLKGKRMSKGDKSINNSKVIAPGMYKLGLKPLSPMLRRNREAHSDLDSAYSCKAKDSNKPLFPSTRVISSTSASGSKPPSNTKKNMISRPTSSNKKNKVEDHLRSVKPSLNKKIRVSKPVYNANVKHSVLNANSELICATCNECLFDAIHDLCVLDYVNNVNVRVKSKFVKSKKKKVWKPTGKIFTSVGYSWKPTARSFTIIGDTCPLTRITSTTVVPPKKRISTTTAKKIQQRSNNSGKLKDITNIGTVRFGNDHVAAIKGYGDYQIGNVMITRDETSEFVIKFLKMIQVRLNATVRNIRIDNGTEFVNQTLKAYYEDVGISHQTSVARTLQQNGVVKRRNRTLVEAARTMLIFSKAPLFLWAEAVATASMAFEQFGSGPELQLMTLGITSSGLVQNPPSTKPYVLPTKNDWDLLFQPIFDEYFNPPPSVVSQVPVVAAPIPADPTSSPSSTSIDQDAPSNSTPSTI